MFGLAVSELEVVEIYGSHGVMVVKGRQGWEGDILAWEWREIAFPNSPNRMRANIRESIRISSRQRCTYMPIVTDSSELS